jgi:hypothetical protein
MTILRLVVLALALAGGSPSVLATEPDVFLVEFRSYRPSIHFFGNDGPAQPMFSVIRTEPEWKQLWSEIEPHMGQDGDKRGPYPAPFIDFRRDTLIVAAAGMKTSGGWSVAIHSMREFPSRILVFVIELRPGKHCMASSVITHPIALALIPRTTKPVDFDIIRGETACE